MKIPIHIVTLATFVTVVTSVFGQGTAFTYQGRLTDGAHPVNGAYELQFTLYDAATSGNAVSSAVSLAPVPVTNGLFTVPLDFGGTAFTGAPRWLEITVNVYGSDSPAVVLSPRQPILPTPYAVHAAHFSGPITDGQLSPNIARLDGGQTFTGPVQFANPSNSFAGTFTGNGAAVTNVNLATINSSGAITSASEPTFTLAALLEVGRGPSSLAAADVNNDGRIDLICANYYDGTLSVLTNNSQSGSPVAFSLASTPVANPYGTPCVGLRTVVATNANGDAHVDFICGSWRMTCGEGGGASAEAPQSAVSCGGSGTVTVLTNDGSGGFLRASWEFFNYYPQWPSHTSIAADLNGDGHAEFISVPDGSSCHPASWYDHTVSVFLNVPFNFIGNFTGRGTGLSDLNASNLASGTVPSAALGNAWKIDGNTGTTPGVHFLGTTDGKGLVLKAGESLLRLEPYFNIVAGLPLNFTAPGITGATISGGGSLIWDPVFGPDGEYVGAEPVYTPNEVCASFGTVGGGFGNTSSGYASTVSGGQHNASSNQYAVVPGGQLNTANGAYSFAAGRRAKALHDGAFVWADSTDEDIASTSSNQFLIRASGGVGINTNDPAGAALNVAGTIRATNFDGPIAASQLPSNIARLDGNQTFTGPVQFANTSNTFAGTFSGNGSALTGLNAYELTGALRLEPSTEVTDPGIRDWTVWDSVNLIGGSYGNAIDAGVSGGTISGGGNVVSRYDCPIEEPDCIGYGGILSIHPNRVREDFGTVSGGLDNTSSGYAATVGGGSGNSSSGYCATASGGEGNTSSGHAAAVGGGHYNTSSGYLGTVSGGAGNTSSNNFATVPGGSQNTAGGQYSFAAGYRAKALHDGSFVWADATGANVSSTSSNQFVIRASGGLAINTNDPAGAALNVAGTVRATNFEGGGGPLMLSSTHNQPLELKVSGERALRLDPVTGWDEIAFCSNFSVNVIAGSSANYVEPGIGGATLFGGGWKTRCCYDPGSRYCDTFWTFPNRVIADFGTVSGGLGNTGSGYAATVSGGEGNTSSGVRTTISGGYSNSAQGDYGTVPGGYHNSAGGTYSFATGRRAKANHSGSFVWADSTDADISSTAENQFTVRASGGVRFLMSPEASGAELAPGSGAWSTLSDRNAKTNFAPANAREILDKVAALPLATWSYKSQDESIRHIGPTAQDFHAAFGLGENDRTITTVDADGVALAAIQGLNQKLQEKDTEIADLKRRLIKLEELLNR